MSFSYHIEEKLFIEASCTNNIRTGKKGFLQLPLLKFCGLFDLFEFLLCFEKTKCILLVRRKFSFLYVDIWFDVTKLYCEQQQLMFSPIFVADTKINYVYNFVAPFVKHSNYSI